MATLAEVEEAITSVRNCDGFIIVDERLRRLAEREPLSGGACSLILLGDPEELDGLARSCRPGDASGPRGGLGGTGEGPR